MSIRTMAAHPLEATPRSNSYVTIQMRRGLESQMDKSKFLPAEFGATTDTKKLFFAFGAGDVQQLATYQNLEGLMAQALAEIEKEHLGSVTQATQNAINATSQANSAATAANQAAEEANTAAQAAENALEALEDAVSGTIINDNTPSDVTTYSGAKIEDKFSNLYTSGGNLLRGTKSFDTTPGYVQYQSPAEKSGEDENGFGILDIEGNGNWNGVAIATDIDPSENALSGKWCVISFDAKSEVLKTQKRYYCIVFSVFGKNGNNQKLIRVKNQNTYYFDAEGFNSEEFVDGQWVRVKLLIKITDTSEWKVDSSMSYTQYRYGFQLLATNVNGDKNIQVKKMKMEISNIPSSWSPNQYDITKDCVKENGDGSNVTVTFQQVAERAMIQSGDSLAVAFGKLAKFCADIQDYIFSAPVASLSSTDAARSLAASMGKRLNDDFTAKFESLNSALDDIEQSNQPFVEQWIDGMTRYEVIISFDDIDISKTNRIPVLIGGNINNAPFLYMYKFDLPNLPQNATAVEGTPILQISQTFYVTGNKDGGNSRRLRILFNNQTNSGAHVYIDVKVCGGEVIGTNTYPLS